MTSLRLSQFAAVALLALTVWALIVGSELEPGQPIAVGVYGALGLIALAVFVALHFALRWATKGVETHWSFEGRPNIRAIGWMIIATFAVMYFVSGVMNAFTPIDPIYSSEVAYLLGFTLAPAAFLQFGKVAWPDRLSRPTTLSTLTIGAVVLCAAAAYSVAAYVGEPERLPVLPLERHLVRLGAVIIGATAEEVIFRVLMLTALLDLTGSRFQAVFLSSVAFALMHVPGEVAQSIAERNWSLLSYVATDYPTRFLGQLFLGLVLGVVWLRTGSITLIASAHAVFNLGLIFARGFG